MMKRSSTSASRPRLRAARADVVIASLLLSALVGACKPAASDNGCVSVGSGWQACSTDMQASAVMGSPGEQSVPMMDTAMQAKPAQNAPKGGSAGGLVTGRPPGGGEVAAGAGGAGGASGRAGAGLSAGASAAGANASGSEAGASGSGVAGSIAAGSSGDRTSVGRAGMSGELASAGRAGAAGVAGGAAGASGIPTTCCHSLAVCVESASLREEQRSLLVPDSCAGKAELCAPTAVLATNGFVPKTCRSVLQGEGRCLPDCMAGLAGQANRLPRDTCDTHELCAPCFDPITGSATGSCTLGADQGPRELPHIFRGCCLDTSGATQGLCVPRAYVPAGAAAPQADCGPELLCVPRQRIVDPNAKTTECSTEIRGRGICLSQCIADALALLVTVQATCPAGNACFPCELVGGESTGVCPAP